MFDSIVRSHRVGLACRTRVSQSIGDEAGEP